MASCTLRDGIFRLRHPNRKPLPHQASKIGDLLHLHADADNWLARQCGGHDGSDASVNDGEVRHLIHLDRRDPACDENVRRNAGSGNHVKLKSYRRDHAVRLAFKTLDDLGDDLGRSRASHGEVDQRLVPGNGRNFRGN